MTTTLDMINDYDGIGVIIVPDDLDSWSSSIYNVTDTTISTLNVRIFFV